MGKKVKYLLFGLFLQQQGGLAQLIHLLAQSQVLLLKLQPLVADTNTVVPGGRQRAVQPPHLLLAAGQLLAVAADDTWSSVCRLWEFAWFMWL